MIRRNFSAAALLSLGALTAFAPAPVSALDLPVTGPGRGGPFRSECPGGHFLVGFEGHTGAWIDHIRIRCAPWTAGRLGGSSTFGMQIGTSVGGGPLSSSCLDGTVISGIKFGDTRGDGPTNVIHSVTFSCVPPLGGKTSFHEYSGRVRAEQRPADGIWGLIGIERFAGSYASACPGGQLATGLHGRYGKFVDALALICGPAPTAAPPPPPPQATTPTPAPDYGPATCKSGFVWRVAVPNDLVCVTPDSRRRVAQENKTAASRVQPGGGPYGPNTCQSGFVWREAYDGDAVCVTPQIRAAVRQENQLAASRAVSGQAPPAATAPRPMRRPESAATPPAQKIATAKNDVDIYDSPVQPRRVIAVMRRGVTGVMLEHHPHGWCRLDISSPDIIGWVAQDHLAGCP